MGGGKWWRHEKRITGPRQNLNVITCFGQTDGRGPLYYKTQIQLIQILQISMSSPALVRLRDKAFGARMKLLRVFQTIFKVICTWTEMTEPTVRSSGSARASEHPLISPHLFLISHLFFSLSSIWEQKATLTFPGRSLIHLVRWKEFGVQWVYRLTIRSQYLIHGKTTFA